MEHRRRGVGALPDLRTPDGARRLYSRELNLLQTHRALGMLLFIRSRRRLGTSSPQ